mgnify:CR=1 FL=1
MEGFSVRWRDLYFNVEGEEVVRRAFFSRNPVFDFKENELSERLRRYFRGEKVSFECKLELDFPAFTKRVLKRVLEIPYGETLTYGEIAKELKSSARAVARALSMNKIAVIIPCHRVVSKNGLGGYSWGVEVKKALLRLEGVNFP